MRTCLFLMFLVVAAGCKKEALNDQAEKKVVGKWLFVRSQGGFTGKDIVLPAPGITTYLVLHTDLTYQVIQNGITQKQGKYATALQKSNLYGTVKPTIQYDSDIFFKTYQAAGDSLTIDDDHVEGYSTLYIKKN
ncbi:MAG: hypothetical protein EOP45_22245 [Sphingobacteriaceae bacterium]|nr:MAG: hypothetical protein EOP45_22245 [Sphingobacteriaceae bacterium]